MLYASHLAKASHLINTEALPRWKNALRTAKLFQQLIIIQCGKPLKRLTRRGNLWWHRAKAAV
jgi:hypothetical protein